MMRDFLIKLLRSILEIPHKSLSVPDADYLPYHHKSQRAALSGYALGWKEGLEAAASLAEQTVGGHRAETYYYPSEIRSLALTPWPEHPEYGWNLNCDTCGKPATNMARDVIVTNDPTSTVNSYKPFGTIKLGCDERPVGSVILSVELDPDNHPGVLTLPVHSCRCTTAPLDCQGLDLNSPTGKIDSFIDPASSGSDPWTGADDNLNDLIGECPV